MDAGGAKPRSEGAGEAEKRLTKGFKAERCWAPVCTVFET